MFCDMAVASLYCPMASLTPSLRTLGKKELGRGVFWLSDTGHWGKKKSWSEVLSVSESILHVGGGCAASHMGLLTRGDWTMLEGTARGQESYGPGVTV